MFFLDVLRIEARLQWRSLRFRIGAGIFLLVTCTPPVLVALLLRDSSPYFFGAASYTSWSLDIARFASVVLAMVVAGNQASTLGQARIWPVLSAAGVSNGGFLWRRWAAMVVLLAALTAMPMAVAALVAVALGLPISDPMIYLGPWLLMLVAAAAMMSALWLALVTISGSELGALLLMFVGQIALDYLAESVVEPITGFTFGLYGDWLGFGRLQHAVYGLGNFTNLNTDWIYGFQLASDAAFDVRLMFEAWWPRAAPHWVLAVLLLTTAGAFARRTRRDLKPLRVGPEHPLRNMMRYVHSFRHRYTLDAALRIERRQMLAATLCGLAVFGAHASRQGHYENLAETRFRVEADTEQQGTMPLDLMPVARSVTGELRRDGSIEIFSRVEVENRGDQPIAETAWLLDAFVEIEASADGREIRMRRLWDRLFLTFDPPLEPARAQAVDFKVSGRPIEPNYDITPRRLNGKPFSHRYSAYLRGVRPADIALSYDQNLLSDQRIDLEAHRLMPVPRYTTWKLSPPAVLQGERGLEVPVEVVSPVEDIELSIEVPAGLFVADVCGLSTVNESGEQGRRLVGKCRSASQDYRLFGGRQRLVSVSGKVALAALPGHVEVARQHLPAMEKVATLSAEAWPSLEGLESLVGVEWPPSFDFIDRRSSMLGWRGNGRDWQTRPAMSLGNLILIPESAMVDRTPLSAEFLVSRLLVVKLMNRRSLAIDQHDVFRRVLTAAMAQRMGLGPESGATVTGKEWDKFWAAQPVLGSQRRNSFVSNHKIPAITVDLMARVGAARFYSGVDEFLDSDREQPGTVEELLSVLESQAGIDLQSFYEDHMSEGGKALPELRFLDVTTSLSADNSYLVRGELQNIGSGQAQCPVVVKADGQTRTVRVNVGPKSTTAFEVRLDRVPYTLLLDPDRTCYRWVTKTSDLVERMALGEAR